MMLLDKRKRFFLSSAILTALSVWIQNTGDVKTKFIGIGILGIATIVAIWFSLREGLKSRTSILIFILPVYFSIGSALFWFLLPSSLLTRIVTPLIYAVVMYFLLLTQNVFSVSYIKTIALFRAAKGVGFLLTLFTYFLVMDALISLRLSYLFLGPLVFIFTFPLTIQGLWTVTLDKKFNRYLLVMATIISYVQSQLAIILFFWPVGVVVGSLFLTIIYYIVLGLGHNELDGRLFPQTVREYLTIGVVVFLVMLFSTSWNGT